MASITSANSTFVLSIAGLYTVPQALQGYASDDAFSTEAIEIAETKMGVDGVFSAGWIPQIIKQTINLQADSASNTLFETWYQAQIAAKDVYWAKAVITLPSVGKAYTLINGILKSHTPIADVKKTLNPRRYMLEWGSVVAVPISTGD